EDRPLVQMVMGRRNARRLSSLFDVSRRGAGIAIGRGGNARLIAARAAAGRGALGSPTANPGGGGVLQLLPHPIELRGVLGAEPSARKGGLLAMTSTTTTHRHTQ